MTIRIISSHIILLKRSVFPESHSVHPHLPQLPLDIGRLNGVSFLYLLDQTRFRVLLGYPQKALACVDHRQKLFSVNLKWLHFDGLI